MVKQHARRDLLVAIVLHLKLRYVIHQRRIQIDFALVNQLHHSGGREHFAGRTDPV
ncbi:hypothetical protein D3C76_1681680 [compost metagenome]